MAGEILDGVKVHKKFCIIYTSKAMVFSQIKRFDEAILYADKALAMAEEVYGSKTAETYA